MPLPFTVDSLEGIDESLHSHYVEEDGKFRLNVEGYEEPTGLKKALQSERDNAKQLKRQLSEMQSKLTEIDGVDLGAVKELLDRAHKDQEAKMIAEGRIDEVLNKRTENLRRDFEKQLELEKERAKKATDFAERFRERVLADAIRKAAIDAGVHAHAQEDVIYRASSMFKLDEDGNPVALDSDGSVIIGRDGESPLSPSEWLESIKENTPHWYPQAHGAGPTGDRGNNAGKKWSDFSETERAQLARDNPKAFEQLLKTRGG